MVATVLMVAEKPSLAQSLAGFLARGPINSRKGGGNPVHEYRADFLGRDAHFKFTSVAGHVMTCDFTGAYNNWDRCEPVELFDAPVVKKESNPGMHMPRFLQREAKGCDYLVLWLDCDKEGENICFEVIDCVSSVMRVSFSSPQTVFRARFSALTANDIRRAMNNLVLPNELESLSVDARMEIDLRIGCAFTRFQTRFFHGKYGDLDSSVISYGPCQTPTLGFCVERHDKIQSFVPEPYWVLIVRVRPCQGNTLTEITLDWAREREFKLSVAKQCLSDVQSHGRARVTDIVQKDKAKQRPCGLNTVEMLRVASAALGIGPHSCMQIAERLYMNGYISYPRTETTAYPKQFNFMELVQMFAHHPDVGDATRDLISSGFKPSKGGVDVGDHPPITPCRMACKSDLDHDSWRLYDYIMRHFLGSLASDLKYLQTTITFMIGREQFCKTGAIVLDAGFSRFCTWVSIAEGYLSSNIRVGDEFSIVEAKLVEKKTTPPDYLSESDLISLMEKHGIGTDASIPTHINNICTRNYVTVTNGRRLVPTQLGIILVHGYQKIDNDLVLPTRRAEIERELNRVIAGTAQYRDVLRDTLREFKQKFDFFVANIAAMDQLFEVCFTSLAETGKPMSRCGRCLRYMKLITAKPQRLYCPNCKETFSVPQKGIIKLYKEIKCPLDRFELLYMQSDRNERSFPFCPQCYNNPPFETMLKAQGCNECTNADCEQSMIKNTIKACTFCTYGGNLVLDVGSGPKKWYISCTKCTVMYQGLDKAIKVKVKRDQECETCHAKMVFVEHKADTSKGAILADTPLKMTECIFCGPHLKNAIHMKGVHKQYEQQRQPGGRMRVEGRGRGARQQNAINKTIVPTGPDGDSDIDDFAPGGGEFVMSRGRGRGRGGRGGRGRGARGSSRGRGGGGFSTSGGFDQGSGDPGGPRGFSRGRGGMRGAPRGGGRGGFNRGGGGGRGFSRGRGY